MKQITLFAILLGIVVFAIPTDAAPPQKDVNATIVNTPVPIQGDVNITNTSLPVSGTVDIGNTPLPVTVENAGNESIVRVPFQFEASVDDWTGRVNFPISLTDLGFLTSDRLVIEHISAHLVIAPDQRLQFFTVDTMVGTMAPATHYVSVPQSIATDSNGNDIYTVSQSLRMYTDGGFGVTLSLVKTPPLCDGFPDRCDAAIAISGYVIPGDSPSLAP